jgi:hypothetical protein
MHTYSARLETGKLDNNKRQSKVREGISFTFYVYNKRKKKSGHCGSHL